MSKTTSIEMRDNVLAPQQLLIFMTQVQVIRPHVQYLCMNSKQNIEQKRKSKQNTNEIQFYSRFNLFLH